MLTGDSQEKKKAFYFAYYISKNKWVMEKKLQFDYAFWILKGRDWREMRVSGLFLCLSFCSLERNVKTREQKPSFSIGISSGVENDIETSHLGIHIE